MFLTTWCVYVVGFRQNGAVPLLCGLLRRSSELPAVMQAAVAAIEALCTCNRTITSMFVDAGVHGNVGVVKEGVSLELPAPL